jgi:hypothetical protein
VHTHAVVSVGSQRAKPRRLSIHTQRERERERERERDTHIHSFFTYFHVLYSHEMRTQHKPAPLDLHISMMKHINKWRRSAHTYRRHWTYIYL